MLTETKETVKDQTTDIFLRKFDENAVNSIRLFKRLDAINNKLIKAFTNSEGSVQSKQYVDGDAFSMYGITDCVEVPYSPEYLAKLYEVNAIHAASVDAKIDNIAGLGHYWDYSRKAEKIRQRAALKDDDKKNKVEDSLIDDKQSLDDALDSMNGFDSFEETITKVLKDRFTTGNGYLEIGRRKDGTIGYIGHIPSIHMRVRRTRDGYVQYQGEQPIFFRNFGDKKTRDPFGVDPQPNEIIHYKNYSPTNNYYGIPEIISSTDNIAGIEFANKYNIEYFEHKAVPRYFITVKGATITKAVYQDILRMFETSTQGKHHRSVIIPLPSLSAEIEFHPIETKTQEAGFVEWVDQNTAHILARHRVPANRLGMTSGTGIGDSRDANKIFKETVCGPEQKLLERKLSKVFRELTDLFVFKFAEYTLTDENEKSAIHERYLRLGALTPDEVRTDLGKGPRADGKGDEPVDAKSMQDAALESSATMQTEALANAEKIAKSNAAATKAAAAAKPAAAASTGGAAGKAASAQKATANKSRTRDSNRSANQTDSTNATQSRNAKGTGRKQA
ncbi:portal protein [Rhodococcus phage NiceHouse]|nr:portal protein [Rhodococcus phage NiceHouse]